MLARRSGQTNGEKFEVKSEVRGLKIAFTSLTPLVCQSELGNEIASSCTNGKGELCGNLPIVLILPHLERRGHQDLAILCEFSRRLDLQWQTSFPVLHLASFY